MFAVDLPTKGCWGVDAIGSQGRLKKLDGAVAPTRPTACPVGGVDDHFAQEAYPTGDEPGHTHNFWIVLAIEISEKVETVVALTTGYAGGPGQEPSRLVNMASSDVMGFMSVEALPEDDGAGNVQPLFPRGRYIGDALTSRTQRAQFVV